MNYFNIVSKTPLDQFEIRSLLSLNLPILGNLQISLTNIALYLIIAVFIIFILNLLFINYNILLFNIFFIFN